MVRVTEGLSKTKLTGDELAKHVAGATRFFTLLNIARWMTSGSKLIAIVARDLPIPHDARAFPSFLFSWGRTRDDRAVFGQWDGGPRPVGHVIAPLTEEQLRLNVAAFGPDLEALAEDIASTWTPAREFLLRG